MYVDSTSCSDCAISHLSDWAQLDIINNYRELMFKYVFIVAPKREQYMHISKIIEKDTVFNESIFIDTIGVFERYNTNLPKNKLLHSFLINKQRNVELIGNPITNIRIKDMLIKILDEADKNS